MIIMTGVNVFGANGEEFEIGDFIASGGFGSVFKASKQGGNQPLAIKTLSTPFADEDTLKVFLNEGKLAVEIRHPNVIEYIYFHDGEEHPLLPPYVLMEYADGGTLRDILKQAVIENRHFLNEELVGIYRQMIAGMRAINAKLVHRDIKPENILLSGGIFKISDFGLSKGVDEATRRTTFKGYGTYPYMAPEAWRGEKNTLQLDIYAMGVVFYELATLRLPIKPKSLDPQAWMDAHIFDAVPNPTGFNPNLSPEIAQVIVKMLDKSRAKRFTDWDSIEKFFTMADRSVSGNIKNSTVTGMIQRRLEADVAEQAKKTEAERVERERSNFCKLVLSQFEQWVFPPIRSLVDEFNNAYVGQKASFTASGGTLGDRAEGFKKSASACVSLPGGRINIEFEVCLPEDFEREVTENDFGRRFTRRKIILPHLRDTRVQGWGLVKASDGRGFNIVLLEEKNEIYGRFVIFENTSGFFGGRERPTPFPFEFNEIEKEIRLIGAMHIYSTKVHEFNDEFLTTFVSSYV